MTKKPHVVVDQIAAYVLQLKAKINTLNALEAEVRSAKEQLRATAATLLPQGMAGSVEFTAPGGGLTVVFGDPEAEGNRSSLTDSEINEALAAGIDVDQVTEVEETVVLSGPWVGWFKQALATMDARMLPVGWTIKRIIRLSLIGVRALSQGSAPAASRLLFAGMRTASVRDDSK